MFSAAHFTKLHKNLLVCAGGDGKGGRHFHSSVLVKQKRWEGGPFHGQEELGLVECCILINSYIFDDMLCFCLGRISRRVSYCYWHSRSQKACPTYPT